MGYRLQLRAAGLSDIGGYRERNEDSYCADDAAGLLVLADGMGGGVDGAVASGMVVDSVSECVRGHRPWGRSPRARLVRGLRKAHAQIHEHAAARGLGRKVDSTTAAAVVGGRRCVVALAGDSRVYWFGAGDRRWRTTDDREVGTNRPTRMTANPNGPPRVVREIAVAPGDLVVLTSDGVHDVLRDAEIESVARGGGSPSDICHALVSSALRRGSTDNATAVAGIIEARRERNSRVPGEADSILRFGLGLWLAVVSSAAARLLALLSIAVVALLVLWVMPRPVDVMISTDPPGASLKISGAITDTGSTPWTRSVFVGRTAERIHVEASKDGYREAERDLVLQRGQASRSAIVLLQQTGYLLVSSEPVDAHATVTVQGPDSLDGSTGVTCGETTELRPGTYVVVGTAGGFPSLPPRTVEVADAETTEVLLVFSPQATGSIRVHVVGGMEGADVLLDGVVQRKSIGGASVPLAPPCTLPAVPVGHHTVTLRQGAARQVAYVEVTAGGMSDVFGH
jgi:protein phosphatase